MIGSVPLELMRARAALYAAPVTPTSVGYVRKHDLDSSRVARVAGCFAVMRADVDGNRFELSDDGRSVIAIVEALGRRGESVLDLVGWPLDEPARLLTLFGRAPMLGLANVFAATTYAFDRPLMCHRTALGWWRARCAGAVILDPQSAARILLDAPGRISGEDREHSLEIAELVQALFDPSRFVAPADERRRVA